MELVLALSKGRRVISVDETGFSRVDMNKYHYATKSEVWSYSTSKSKVANTTCILAVSQFGLELSKFIQGSANSVYYLDFIMHLVNTVTDFRHPDRASRPVILMDNCSIHHVKALKAYLREQEVDYLFTSSYSPFINPVELANGRLKHELAKNGPFDA